MVFPKQKIQANNSKSVLKPNRRIHIRPKHKCRSVFSLLFLLIKLAPLISSSSVTQDCLSSFVDSTQLKFLIALREEPKKTECEASLFARLFLECDYIFAVWTGVRKVASADNRSVFYCACEKIRHANRKQLKFVTSFVNSALVSRESNLQTTNLLKLCFVFLLFSLWF